MAVVGRGAGASVEAERRATPLLLASEDFDLYCEMAAIEPHDQGIAFAAWLNEIAGDADFDGGSY